MLVCLRSAANAIAELESATRSCNRCHQPFELDETYVVLEGTSWHQDCFRCAQCLLELSLGEDFFEVDGRFYCKHDFEVLYAPICTKCSRQLIVPEDMLRINNDFFHAYHFHCSACRLVSTPVSPLTSEARQLEKQWYCQRCFDLRCETCAGCHKAIDKLREKSAVALGKAFHAEHFRCVKCDVAFMGRQHYEHSGKAYCEEDFIKMMLKWSEKVAVTWGHICALRWVRQNFPSEFQNSLRSRLRDVWARVTVQQANFVEPGLFLAQLVGQSLQLGRPRQ
ncbi:unnamed protein product [Heligmosomoides polygyrus]|uniref:LIM domain protein n=1 Tax=Heligmosomoides polygyrus TaxID=6339 RepID=A0A3P7XQB8_HELPZ|nr:unnamed protein product [Heligmosomoides polygyrus]